MEVSFSILSVLVDWHPQVIISAAPKSEQSAATLSKPEEGTALAEPEETAALAKPEEAATFVHVISIVVKEIL